MLKYWDVHKFARTPRVENLSPKIPNYLVVSARRSILQEYMKTIWAIEHI